MSSSHPVPYPSTGAPVCPRHPDRVSYVSCQRCGRPACPDCQRSAAVGIQCVDCVSEASKSVPSRRTIFGGVVRTGRPLVTITMMAICVAMYALDLAIPKDFIFQNFAYAPFYTETEPWRMVTSAFLHSTNLMHIAFNMYALWILGNALESAFGRVRFLAVYLVSAFAGSVGVLLLSPIDTVVVGASGAVFGLFGALFVVQKKRGGDLRQIVVLLAINAAIGFVIPNIAWQAHLGGLIAGALCTAAIAYAPTKNRNLVQWGGIAAVTVLLLALTAYKVSTFPAFTIVS
ncbi:rhomboid family intramembrane serine protease [Arthrobacter alpinus]|uniref:Rhomboid family intramembrane serine protease n=1 Tax=Arthrobacter alpinus TaxID=656366 RepID=A0A0S2LVQ5_9MICC|nr:rhomboid family intramembrane serine protease [Arthrobacter alpinus]ALO65562.1 rhomboid family intramembrane serine protease [Arthrobacter alpinus]MDD0859665.1 rhomboid family intramembrane serine protease [Arthrobacter alpinus]